MLELLIGIPVTALVAVIVGLYMEKFDDFVEWLIPLNDDQPEVVTIEDAVAEIDGHMTSNEGAAQD